MGSQANFPLSALGSTSSRGRASVLMWELTAFYHVSLQGSGRAGSWLRVKNNICTLWQLHQNHNPIERAHESWMSAAVVGAVLVCSQRFSAFPPFPVQHPGVSTCIFVGVALGPLGPHFSCALLGWKYHWINILLGSAINHWLVDVQVEVFQPLELWPGCVC